MSADPDKDTACPKAEKVVAGSGHAEGDTCTEITEKKKKNPLRSVRFPDENQLVTQYFEPANPWHDVPTTTRAQLAAEYLEACRRHNTMAIDSVLQQIRELPENAIGGGNRAARLSLASSSLEGAAPVDALEALLRKVQFRRLEVEHCEIDDEGAEALFDMIEYYESANVVCISGPRQFGIRGWQAACRMIKKSAELIEIEVCESALCASHAPVLVRALRPHTCRLRALCLQRASLQGEPLLCLVIALKSNSSIRELRLPDNQLMVRDAQQLASLLRFNLNIQLLDLSNNQIQDAGTGHIADALVEQAAQTPPSAATSPLSPHHYPLIGHEARVGLAVLVLWNNQLTRNCAQHLSKALRSSQSLCVLNIGRNSLGAEGVLGLRCCGLVSLGLQGAALGPAAAAPLASLVRRHTALQRLDLRDNRLGVVGLQAILNAMKDNTTLTQIDLDDPGELTTLTADGADSATIARLSRDILATCRRNEPPATEPERRVHRKISLTCHTAFAAKMGSAPCDARRSRLRSPAPSPAPSPAGSPIPAQHNSRFSVTRVTPERDSSAETTSPSTPTRPTYCLTPSRFKVVQVVEPPLIQAPPIQKRAPAPSRFSVTRNYDAIYNPSPSGSPSPSPTPSISPVPSGTSVNIGSPTVMSQSQTVISGSPTAIIQSPTVTNESQTVVSRSPTVIRESPTVMSQSPTVMSQSPTVMSQPPTVMSQSPTVMSESQTVISGSTAVISGSPTVMSQSPTVTSESQTVISRSPAVINGSPTVISGSVINRSKTAINDAVTAAVGIPPTVTIIGAATLGSGSQITSGNMVSESPTVTLKTFDSTVLNAPTVIISDITTPKVLRLPSTQMSCTLTQTPMVETSTSVPLKVQPEDLTAVKVTTQPLTKPSVTTIVSTETLIPEISNLSKETSVPSSVNFSINYVTSAVKISTMNTAQCTTSTMTSVTELPPYLSISHTPITETRQNITGKSQDASGTIIHPASEMDRHISTTIGPLEKSIETIASGTVPVESTLVEDIWKNYTLTLKTSDTIGADITGTASTITMTGTISGTSTATLSGTTSSGIPICESLISEKEIPVFKDCSIPVSMQSELLYTRSEPLINLVDIGSNAAIVGAKSSPVNVDRSIFAPEKIDKSIYAQKVPIPDEIGVVHSDKPNIEIPKTISIGSQIIKPLSATTNIVPDIFMELAEFTEPKVVKKEPKDVANAIDLDKVRTRHISEVKPLTELIANINRNVVKETNASISSITDMPSKIGPTKLESIEEDETMGERAMQQILPKHVSETNSDTPQFVEQIKTEQGSFLNDKNISADIGIVKSMPVKESVVKTGLKSILKEESRLLETKPELTENVVKEINVTSLEDRSSDSKTPVSDKDISDTKKSDTSAEGVKNKTYSDVVKSDPKYKDKSEQLTHKEEISDSVVKTETKLVKSSVEVSDSDKVDVQIEVTVKKECVQDAAKVHSDQNKDFVKIDDIIISKKEGRTMKQIEALTEDLGNLLKEMRDMSSKSRKVKDCTVDIASVDTNKVPGNYNRDVVLKKNKSESSLDSPDLEVSRLMNKKLIGSPFCDSSSSLEISGSSMESLNAIENQHATCHVMPRPVVIQESVESDTELDRRKDVALSTGSSIESTSEVTPVNSGNLLNMSVSSNESVSPIIFGKKKIHDSLSSLEASMSSLEKVMVTSADSGIEYSLQHPSENKEDNSSNEGTLTHNSSLRETVKKAGQDMLTSPKRASSLLDVPALKTKGLDKMRKISWVAPSSSFHIPRLESEKIEKPSHLEKLLSLFQHPTSLFSRGSQSDEERKSASNTPPRKDSSLTSSFWSWGSTIEKEKDDKDDSSEATDSTLSERVQVSFVDESFSKKLDSKTPSTDTDNTLSEFQSFPIQATEGECTDKVTDNTTDENLVQKCLGLSLNTDKTSSNGNTETPRASDMTDLSKPNDMNSNYESASDAEKNAGDIEHKSENVKIEKDEKEEAKLEPIRPRSFAAVLKSSGSENSLDKQPSPDSGQPVDKLPSKVIRGIKENISPENTLTSSMTNTKALALELTERQVKTQPAVAVWEISNSLLDKTELKTEPIKTHSDLAPIATIEETCDEAADNTVNIQLEFIDDVKIDEEDIEKTKEKVVRLENVDLGKDALSYLIYESQDLEPDTEHTVAARAQVAESSLAQELKEAAIKEMLDLSPELVIDEAMEIPEVFTTKEIKGPKSSPVIPERAKLKKSNSLEDLSQRSEDAAKASPKTKTIAFKVPETTSPRDIPERRSKLRTMSGSSPKSLPESLNKPSPLTKIDSALRKRKKVSSLGKMAKDSLLALNMSEDEIAEYRRSYVTSVESLRSLESVSEDANSQSGTSVDSRCRACLRTSQESLMSLDSITEDCKCVNECDRTNRSVR